MAALGELVMEMIKELGVEGNGLQKGWFMAKQFDQEEDTARTSSKETKNKGGTAFSLGYNSYFKDFGQTLLSGLLLFFSLLLFCGL